MKVTSDASSSAPALYMYGQNRSPMPQAAVRHGKTLNQRVVEKTQWHTYLMPLLLEYTAACWDGSFAAGVNTFYRGMTKLEIHSN